MSLSQQSNNAIKLDIRSKRLRHVHLISAKNLQIKSNKFEVWFTLHLTDRTRAFYISEKRENDTSPRWYSLNGTKLPYKSFIVRIWVKDLEKKLLNLFLEVNVHLDGLVVAQLTKKDHPNLTNVLFFEIFGKQYCENLQENNSLKISDDNKRKNSYSFNLMTRLHDFQRVMHETSLKITELKQTSMNKFEASSRLRELQGKKKQALAKICLYKEQLASVNKSVEQLSDLDRQSKEQLNTSQNNLLIKQESLNLEKLKVIDFENSLEMHKKVLHLQETKLTKRKKQMIQELGFIFQIERLNVNIEGGSKRNRMKIINTNFRSYNKINVSLKNVEHQNAVVLGYIIHAIQIISNILNIPLRHPVVFRGSKSFIIEQLNTDQNSEFPLFKQNSSTQDLDFAHAVTLLNKNLSQLRITFDSYKNVDTNDMLGNLKWMFDHL